MKTVLFVTDITQYLVGVLFFQFFDYFFVTFVHVVDNYRFFVVIHFSNTQLLQR